MPSLYKRRRNSRLNRRKSKSPKQRKLSLYNQFIKKNYNKVRNLPPNQRFKALAKMWKAQKSK